MATAKSSVSFSKEEKITLQQIVGDWLNEEIVVPPFEPAIDAVLQKLGLGEEESGAVAAPVAYPKSQEALSVPRTKRSELESSN